jgi:hypothetical protein
MKTIKGSEKSLFIFIFPAILLGVYLRASAVLSSHFPLNDGGLFFSMTQDLIDNHFRLPLYTSYNQAQIPYAYPPAAFYLLGFLNQAFKISLIDLFRFFPLACNILVLFFIFPIARLILDSERQALIALYAYAFLWPSYHWLIMGGGVTRAPAQLFGTLAILGTLGYYKLQRKKLWLACAVLSITLCGYFHIETAWVTAVEMAFLAILFERSRKTLFFLLVNACGGALLLSPYWVYILRSFGANPFLAAFFSGYTGQAASIGLVFVPMFTEEKIIQILAVLSILGIFACIATRCYTPVLLFFLIILVNPRSVHRSAVLPEALLIAVCLDVLVLQGLESAIQKTRTRLSFQAKNSSSSFPIIAVGILLLYTFLLIALQQMTVAPTPRLTDDQAAALTWIKNNTDEKATFLILPTSGSWADDSLSEWFPALTGRRSVLTPQGYEWTTPAQLQDKVQAYQNLVRCIQSGDRCYGDWKTQYGIVYDYLFMPKHTGGLNPDALQAQGFVNGCRPWEESGAMILYHCSTDEPLTSR